MNYRISFDEELRAIEIYLGAGMSHAEHLRARDELLALCERRESGRVLIDARDLTTAPDSTSLFDFAAMWAERARRHPFAFAGVIPATAAVREWWQFGETVALNRGVVTRSFDSVSDAKAWLRSTLAS